jgi:uncharacterized repeat protein (TIGR01451 family)
MNRNFFRTCTLLGAIAAVGVLASCGESSVGPKAPISPAGPSFDATVPFNNGGQCMGDDAVDAPTGTVPGVKNGGDPLKAVNCTSNDVKIARTNLISYQTSDGQGNFGPVTAYNAGDNVTCLVNSPIKLNLTAELDENANSERTDIGIWIATDGGKAITGACNHYNLVPGTQNVTNEAVGSTPGPDSCGDLNAGAVVPAFPLGEITAVCTTGGTGTLLHVGSCLGWKEPGADKLCPLTSEGATPNGFRFGTLPGNASKCNCDGFDVPITVVRDPSVSLTKTADSASVSAGSPIGFTVTVTNAGPANATNLVVTDTLPGGTGVSWSIETNPIPTGWALGTSGGKQILTFTSSSFGIGSTSVHVVSSTTASSCKQYDNTAHATASNQTTVSDASASTTVKCPSLSLVKKPDAQGDPGYSVAPGDSGRFTIKVWNSSTAGTGDAKGVVLTDTLPADLTWVADNTTTCPSPMGTVTGTDTKTHQRLICNIGTLAPGDTFRVKVAALVPNNFTQSPPSSVANAIEIDGNLVDGGAPGKDWATVGINCISNPKVGCDIDLATGTGDNSFGQGTKEDTPVPTLVFGSIPNNKSDLLRFYVANERVVSNDFLYLAWERVQAPKGTTNMDFELNQSSQASGNGVTPVRTAGDILVLYDLERGGSVPTLAFSVWVTSGNPATVCEASNALPCWGKRTTILNGAAADINDDATVSDPILAAGQASARTLDKLTFGEASIDLQTTGIFTAGACVSFGQAYLKSRSSDSFTSEIKDFIAPIPINVTNCAPVTINNTAWVSGSNVSTLSDAGQIKVENP